MNEGKTYRDSSLTAAGANIPDKVMARESFESSYMILTIQERVEEIGFSELQMQIESVKLGKTYRHGSLTAAGANIPDEKNRESDTFLTTPISIPSISESLHNILAQHLHTLNLGGLVRRPRPQPRQIPVQIHHSLRRELERPGTRAPFHRLERELNAPVLIVHHLLRRFPVGVEVHEVEVAQQGVHGLVDLRQRVAPRGDYPVGLLE
nr:hypothetical protein Iba_chr10dCG3560 [Ipomoea batatas]